MLFLYWLLCLQSKRAQDHKDHSGRQNNPLPQVWSNLIHSTGHIHWHVGVTQTSHKPDLSVELCRAARTGLLCSHQCYILHALEPPKELFFFHSSLDLPETLPDTTAFITVITDISTKWSISEPSYSAGPAAVKFPRGNEGILRT